MKVLLGVTGGIAAYKALQLVRLYQKAGHTVQVVMSEAAQHFVGPLSFQALTGYAVRTDVFDPAQEAGMDHIALARWADVLVVAPATANTLAKLSLGLADDLLSTLVLASDRPLVLAPAMNRVMWQQPVTQQHRATLEARGVHWVAPESGEQACGETGEGRLASVETIVSVTQAALQARQHAREKTRPLHGKHLVITAGPTHEPLDPVRFLGNRSSGKMGFALAQAAAQSGARVTLISGPVHLDTPQGVDRQDVTTAQEMFAAVKAVYAQADVVIGAAAVADYRVAEPAKHKHKKSSDTDTLTLSLVKNPDILAWVGQKKAETNASTPLVVGFAAETTQLEAHAQAKLQAKQLDMICANWVGPQQGFDQPDNALILMTSQHRLALARSSKKDQAWQVLSAMCEWHLTHT